MQLTKILLDYHRRMLDDAYRTEAFRRAIAAVVRPGDVVVDLGTGTGVLACFACAAGARRVYAVESGPILEVARATVAENGFAERVTFLACDARRAKPKERADVVVSETLGSMGVEENIVELVADARRRLLKPGGRIIPSRVQVWASAVNLPEAYERLTWPSGVRDGLRFSLLRHLFLNTPHRIPVDPAALLGPPTLLFELDLEAAETLPSRRQLDLPVTRPGVCHGVGLWFNAESGGEPLVDTAPGQPPTHWEQIFLPVAEPVRLSAGGHMALELQPFPTHNEVLFAWSGSFYPEGEPKETPIAPFSHSNLHLVPPWQGVDLATKQALLHTARRGAGVLSRLLGKAPLP